MCPGKTRTSTNGPRTNMSWKTGLEQMVPGQINLKEMGPDQVGPEQIGAQKINALKKGFLHTVFKVAQPHFVSE